MEALRPEDSTTVITELMIPSYANFGGKIHGGILLSLMDKVAYACATKHAGNYCVTVSVDEVNFHQPVEVGELVSLMARVNYVGKTSLVVGIKVTAENVKTKEVKHTNTSFFTMVAKDENGTPTLVPSLILENETNIMRFAQAMQRKELRTYHKEHMKRFNNTLDFQELIATLKDERCIVDLK